ncbi:hypothetical protein OG618_37785 (plasmid) [Kitasatospora sp. NBC_01246]|uniref:hypothetical protein n=1 Tax=Kitasatospora sp. NBC_01246 TaxID=2903570 RepID=UPI002E31A3E3|nr:hypothetical protein [Kitasatospora sp. NBC_01246]
MRPFTTTLAVIAAAALLPVLAAPQAQAATRSASACTHRGGPQVCIRVEGEGEHVSRAVAIWTNPPRDVKERTAHLLLDGREVHYSQTATRHGDSVSAEWGWFQFSGQLCVTFDGVADRKACEDVY